VEIARPSRPWRRRDVKNVPTQRRGWTKEQQDASVTQFKKMLPSTRDNSVRLAIEAGKKMGYRLLDVNNPVANLDDFQVENWRKRFCVPPNLKLAMLMAAWSTFRVAPEMTPEEWLERERKKSNAMSGKTFNPNRRFPEAMNGVVNR
jgi:hypothetical protein